MSYTITAQPLDGGLTSSVFTDDRESALRIFERAQRRARERGINCIINVFGQYGDMIATKTIICQEVAG